MIRETITFNFETKAQQRRFHERLRGEGQLPGYDYDKAPTDPAHGGKMTAEMAAARIKELEEVLGEARLQLEYLNEKFPATGTTACVLARISLALAGCDTYDMELKAQ